MGTQAKIVHGARALLSIAGTPVGIFTNVSYGLQYDVQPAYVLGKLAPAELAYTGQEPVQISASGWRVLGKGPHAFGGASTNSIPQLQELLTHQDITLSILDRQTNNAVIMTVTGVRPVGYSTSMASRQLQEITVNFVGLYINDESSTNAEPYPTLF